MEFAPSVNSYVYIYIFAKVFFFFNQFVIFFSQAIMMVTYYAAQLGISLSVVDSKASYLDSIQDAKVPLSPQTPCDSEDETIVEKTDMPLHHTSVSSTNSVCRLRRQVVSINHKK